MDNWAAAMGSGRKGIEGEMCLVGGLVGGLVGDLVGGSVGGLVAICVQLVFFAGFSFCHSITGNILYMFLY
jgi:hypothetical protein